MVFEEIAGQFEVPLVILDDEHQLPGGEPAHDAVGVLRNATAGLSGATGPVCGEEAWRPRLAGSRKLNVLPFPGSLSNQRRPPCSSMNCRESARPRPVPSCRCDLPTCTNSSKIRAWSAGAMPTPSSRTLMITS